MLKEKKPKFGRSLMLIVLICLSSCTTTGYNNCPVYPAAGNKVAEELENISYEQAPHFWQWLGRINKLRLELELCKH